MKLKEWADFNVSNNLIDKDLFIEVIGADPESTFGNFRDNIFRSVMRLYSASMFFGELEVESFNTKQDGNNTRFSITVKL